jgi:hypothetical protein
MEASPRKRFDILPQRFLQLSPFHFGVACESVWHQAYPAT